MAYNRFHRSLTAGVALVGAGAIAFATVPAPLPDEVVAAPAAFVAAPRVVSTEVHPVVLATALQVLATGAVGAIQESIGAFTEDIPAMQERLVATWADTDYLSLNYSLVASALVAPVAPLVVGPFTDAVAEVVAQAFPGIEDEVQQDIVEAVDYAFARVVGPFVSAFSALAVAHLGSYEAGMAGDNIGRIVALLRAPVNVIDGFLNGGYGDLSPLLTGGLDGERVVPPGLLTPWGQPPVDRNFGQDPDDEPSAAVVEDDSAKQVELTAGKDAAELTPAVVTDASSDVTGAVELVTDTETVETVDGEETAEAPAEPTVSEDGEQSTPGADEAAEEKAPSRLSIRQGIKDLRERVTKLTGESSADTADDSAKSEGKSDDAPKAEKAEKAEKPARGSDDTE